MTSHLSSTFPKLTPPSLLILIIDIHPLSWSILSTLSSSEGDKDDEQIVNELPPLSVLEKVPISPVTLSDFINILLVFLNSHLASRWGNRVVVFAASAGRSKLLFPVAEVEEEDEGSGPNVYHPFGVLNKGLEMGLKRMIAEEEARLDDTDGEGLNEPSAIVSAMTKALCYINRHSPPPASESTAMTNETRILVINATPGAGSNSANDTDLQSKSAGGGGMRGGYVGLMNCVFAAQKAKIPIDVLTLPPPSTGTEPPIFLQQASHLTEGVYWRWNGRGGLLQYLHTIYLRPPSLRQNPFSNPPQDAVDFRAVCFCHHDVVDIGFVCSVCLSIFCKPLPVCQMCKTKFPIKSLPQLKSLAGSFDSIPLPQTIPPPPAKKDKKRKVDDSVIIVD